nr:LON peptidase substrate-binding domain-containing protein [Lachnospiraceae bacterium]
MPRITKKTYPCVPLRGLSVLPGMIVHFDLNRAFSIQAVERAMLKDQRIFLLSQRNDSVEEPKEEELYTVGCVASIKQVIKLPNGFVRVLIEGEHRARLLELTVTELYTAVTKAFEMVVEEDHFKLTAMVRELRDQIAAYVVYSPHIGKSLEGQFQKMETVEGLLDCVAANFPLAQEEKQAMLEAEKMSERFAILTAFFARETQVLAIKKQLQDETKERVEKNQKEYVLREQMKYIQEELGEDEESDLEQFRKACEKLKAPAEVKQKIRKEIDRFGRMSSYSSESGVARGYIETLLEMPWNKTSKDNTDLNHAEQILEEDHYGLEKVKERMLEFLAVEFLISKKADRISPIICLVGPPGTGKTSIAKSVARA